MPKNISVDLATHLTQEVVSICTLWEVTRTDGVQFFFTDHDDDLSLFGNTYLAAVGYTRTAVANSVGLSVDNVDVSGFINNSVLTEQELRAGIFDYAKIKVYLVNWAQLAQGRVTLRTGSFGEVTITTDGTFNTQLRGLSQAYSINILETYLPICRTDLGSVKCKIPIKPPIVVRNKVYAKSDGITYLADDQVTPTFVRASASSTPLTEDFNNRIYECTTAGTSHATIQPTYDTVVGHTTTDGTAVFTAREAWTRSAVVATVIDFNRTFTITVTEARDVDGWFAAGAVTWDTGANAGRAMEVKTWIQSSSTVQLFLPMGFNIQVGDKLGIYAGCDKTKATCHDKFNNMLNRRAEDNIPGASAFYNFPV